MSTHGLLQTGIDLLGWQDISDKVVLWCKWKLYVKTYLESLMLSVLSKAFASLCRLLLNNLCIIFLIQKTNCSWEYNKLMFYCEKVPTLIS